MENMQQMCCPIWIWCVTDDMENMEKIWGKNATTKKSKYVVEVLSNMDRVCNS